MLNGMAEVVCRIAGAIVMIGVFHMDCRAIWYTTCLTWTVTGLVGWLRYKGGIWRTKALTEQHPGQVMPIRKRQHSRV